MKCLTIKNLMVFINVLQLENNETEMKPLCGFFFFCFPLKT